MTPLERMAEAYWNAHRDGFIHVGGKAADYPTWSSTNDPETKAETMRCLHHALQVLWGLQPPDQPNPRIAQEIWLQTMAAHFPGKPAKRKAPSRRAA